METFHYNVGATCVQVTIGQGFAELFGDHSFEQGVCNRNVFTDVPSQQDKYLVQGVPFFGNFNVKTFSK